MCIRWMESEYPKCAPPMGLTCRILDQSHEASGCIEHLYDQEPTWWVTLQHIQVLFHQNVLLAPEARPISGHVRSFYVRESSLMVSRLFSQLSKSHSIRRASASVHISRMSIRRGLFFRLLNSGQLEENATNAINAKYNAIVVLIDKHFSISTKDRGRSPGAMNPQLSSVNLPSPVLYHIQQTSQHSQ